MLWVLVRIRVFLVGAERWVTSRSNSPKSKSKPYQNSCSMLTPGEDVGKWKSVNEYKSLSRADSWSVLSLCAYLYVPGIHAAVENWQLKFTETITACPLSLGRIHVNTWLYLGEFSQLSVCIWVCIVVSGWKEVWWYEKTFSNGLGMCWEHRSALSVYFSMNSRDLSQFNP